MSAPGKPDRPAAGSRSRRGGRRQFGGLEAGQPGKPRVTVVTIVKDDAVGLDKTIRSVAEQTYRNLEYVVIDGGSGSPTLDVIMEHEDRIDLWISEPDRGIYDAMNKGIDLASGEWINFMNAGDCFYDKDVVARVFGRDFGDADFIYGHTLFLSGDFRGVVKAWDFDILWKTMVFTHQSLFTRAVRLRARRFDCTYKVCADYDVIYTAYREGRTFFNADTVIAVISPGMSDVNRARMALEKWRTVRRHRKDLKVHAFYVSLVIRRFFRDVRTRIQRRLADKKSS